MSIRVSVGQAGLRSTKNTPLKPSALKKTGAQSFLKPVGKSTPAPKVELKKTELKKVEPKKVEAKVEPPKVVEQPKQEPPKVAEPPKPEPPKVTEPSKPEPPKEAPAPKVEVKIQTPKAPEPAKPTPAPAAAPAKRFTMPAAAKKGKKNKMPIERDGIIPENPEKYYDLDEDEIGRGKFAVVKKATSKKDGKVYAAKIIKFDSDSLKFAIREYDMMLLDKMKHAGLVQLHEAYLVQKYLILIMDYCEGKTLLDFVASKHSLTEEDVATYIRGLCEILAHMHSNNIVHLDLRPTNIRFKSGREIQILDYNSARTVANKKAGAVVDVIGDTEFCAPEMLSFDPVLPASDMWTVAINMYILLSGISPFFNEDEDKVVANVQQVKWKFDSDAFASVTSEAKEFIKKCLVRAPEMRLTAEAALKHPYLQPEYASARKNSKLNCLDLMRETDERLYSEEEEEYIEASLVFRTFDEEEYESPEDDDDEEEE